LNLKEDLEGDYYPLNGSFSYEPKPGGMDKEKQEDLLAQGNLFQEPDSTLLLSSGCGRHWPDAREFITTKTKIASCGLMKKINFVLLPCKKVMIFKLYLVVLYDCVMVYKKY